jgi:pyridoxamine 5'-phosphate oxidase
VSADLDALRREYRSAGLNEGDAGADPIALFGAWLTAAASAGLNEPNAMTLATATADGAPSARMVLLKGYDARGFTFFTNYDSRKSRELANNPRAALVLFWGELERQVRIVGRVERVSAAESDAYFESRPREAQVGALASPQSRPIASRAELEARVAQVEQGLGGATPARPEGWGGWRVIADEIEFWQGRPGRLHDRLLYRRAESGWIVTRLAP